ncbi:MAG: 50S ribosomal protein L11 methyltransferase [Melioribacteraceae bacterium]|nr:50S ribosomal protein L11 methyltransferase [Melioribacteraceae bacterium]
MKKFIQYTVSTTPHNNELISGMLWQFDFAGITEVDNLLNIFVDPENIISENEIALVLEAAKNEGFITEYFIHTSIVEDKNWNEEYEKSVKVIEVSERLVIKPSFKEYNPKENQIVITIDPKMSFGTGEHETTKLILTILEKYISPGDFVLDVGSGTGILAIASVMLGAKKAIGIDNDEWCLLNGNENVKLNSLEEKVEIRLGEISQIEEKNFDLILANINKHILLEVTPHIKSKIKKTGKLILSGLLESDADEILSKYSLSQFEMIEKKQFGDWIAIVFKVSNSH